MPKDSVIDIAVWGLIGIFTIAITYIIGLVIIGGNMYPLMQEFTPSNATQGINAAQYAASSNDLWLGLKTAFYILLSFVFIFLAIKLLYEKEETSSYYG